MRDYPAAMHSLLQAAPDLTALLTGGVYLARDLPRHGLTPQNVSGAYDAYGRLRPLLLISGEALSAQGPLGTPNLLSVRQDVSLRFYGDGDAGFAVLMDAATRAYNLLSGHRLSGAWTLHLSQHQRLHDPDQQHAALIHDVYTVVGYLEATTP